MGGGGAQPRGGPLNLVVKIPDNRAGTVIGRGGITIRSIQEKNRVHVEIPKMADPDDPKWSNSYDIFIRGEEVTSGAIMIGDEDVAKARRDAEAERDAGEPADRAWA